MAEESSRRQNRTSPATTRTDKPSMGRDAKAARPEVIRWLDNLAVELLGAIEDHRKWINSDRARALGTTFEISGRLLTYAAYVALAWLAFRSFVGIRSGLAKGIYVVPEHIDGSRIALFNILATGLVGPIAIVAIGIGIGWAYNLTTAAANRALPRFVRPWVHPSIMFAVVAVFAAYHSTITATVASGYLHAKANIEAASPPETVSVKVIDIPGLDALSAGEDTEHDPSRERELLRLKSIFNNSRPCSNETQGAPLNPQSEVTQPEPGFAPNSDCQKEKKSPHP